MIKIAKIPGIQGKQVAVGEVIIPLGFEYQGQREPDLHVWAKRC
ncbi:MAG: hypothetical protein ACTMUB_01095 [cyanobacterium endosymbiont of Rhopalodia musculus]|nr:hypothetical protein [cyanobacterium endosymbiont of Epithemia clementina EcSB]WGT66863.1 hypothetical protein P3F56_06305 [cyanobacterium endosymbiont of Epithemia clementina EcSB]